MSIQEYIERDYLETLNEVDDNIDTEKLDDEVKEASIDDDDLSKTNFNGEEGVEVLTERHSAEPRVTVRPVNGKNYPTIKVAAVHKKSGDKKIMTLYLKERANLSAATEITDADRLNLKTRLANLQENYPNFVIYSY
jgi:hypothetical protein